MSETPQYLQHELIIEETLLDDSYTNVTTRDEESGKERVQKISTELLPHIKTSEPCDASHLQQLTIAVIAKEILGIFLRYDPRLEDIKPSLQRAGDTIMRNVDIADDIKYGIPYNDRRVHIYHELLLSPKEERTEIPTGK